MRRWGDRKDGKLLRDLDALHFIVPNLYPNRCDNEAFFTETIDLTETKKYLRKKNAGRAEGEEQYSLFMVIVGAVLKMIVLRPRVNRFICNKNIYQRNEVTAGFIVRQTMDDDSEEGLACVRVLPESTIEDIHRQIPEQVEKCRNVQADSTDKIMELMTRLPRFITKPFISFVRWLDKHGWVPQSFIQSDPYYTSILLSNLGSVRLHAGYHHLVNWGTNSFFITIGEKKKRPFYKLNGEVEFHDSIDLGITIDERIADGFYFSKSVRLLRKLIENPELLEQPFSTEVKY